MTRTVKMLVCAALVLAATCVGASRSGAAPPQWSLQRASIVLTAQGAVFDHDGQPTISSFLPSLGLSYSATSAMSLVAIAERDFVRKLTVGRLGARFRVANLGDGAIGLGIDGVFYADEGRKVLALAKETSWQASVHGEFPVAHYKNNATMLFLTTSAAFDPNNSLRVYRGGLRFQLVGGRP